MTKVIALDAGHGLYTAGKQTLKGSKGIIKEWTLNDKVRDYVVEYLKDYDAEFIFPDNNEGKVDESLSARVRAYINVKADVFVSLHHNAFKSRWGKHTGVEVWVDRNYTKKDMELAKAIYKHLPGYTGLVGRGIKKEDWAVINQNQIPAVLTEGGFMDSEIDYPVITSTAGQKAYAKAVAEGLIDFLDLKKKTTTKPVTKPETTTKQTSQSKSKFGEGDKVVLSKKSTVYKGADDGKSIPDERKGKTYTVKKLSPDGKQALLKEINSWVLASECTKKTETSKTTSSKTTTTKTTSTKKAKKLYLPKTATHWNVYPTNKTPVVGNECGALNPSLFGGLTYDILATPQKNVVTIKTRDYGKVNIYVGSETGAVIK